ncbi:hypothetical protein ACQEVB_29095 [Pseudonocardia sp. CA-107938]|uniref:hypothetical protein n=1 Tax=Pseudonocardia sp. CA-107938 TaxID=3240021 RepID=UPI003D92D066
MAVARGSVLADAALTVLAVVVTALGVLALALVTDGAPPPGAPMTVLAWFYPVMALLTALVIGIGVLVGRIPGIATVVLLMAAPLLVTALPVEAVGLADRLQSPLASSTIDLLGTYVPFVIAGALLPYVLDVRIRPGTVVAVVVGVAGAAVAVWLSGTALRFLPEAGSAPRTGTLLGAGLMLAATAVVAMVSAAARGRPLVGLVAAGVLVVLWAAAALAPVQVQGVLGDDVGTRALMTTLCSQIWFTIAGLLALPAVGQSAERGG